jgi:TPR repeat protein
MGQAIYWWKQAALQGNAASQSSLGNCYSNGQGVEKDEEEAVYWWRKAASQGDITATDSLKVIR